MRKLNLDQIEHRWSFASLSGASISLTGSSRPGTTVHALRCAPDGVTPEERKAFIHRLIGYKGAK